MAVAVSIFEDAQPALATLESIAAQTHARLEVLVAPATAAGAQTAAAFEVERWLQANAGRFERSDVLSGEAEGSVAAARNAAFRAAASPAVLVLDAGVELLPRAVSRLADALASAHAACAYPQLLLEDGGVGTADVWRRDGFVHGDYVGSTALVRHDAWARVGGYTPMGCGWEAYDFWCKLVEAGLWGVYVPEFLGRRSTHDDAIIGSEISEDRRRSLHAMLALHPWLELRT